MSSSTWICISTLLREDGHGVNEFSWFASGLVTCFKMSPTTVRHDAHFLMTCVNWDALKGNTVGGHISIYCRSNDSPQRSTSPAAPKDWNCKLVCIVCGCFRNCCWTAFCGYSWKEHEVGQSLDVAGECFGVRGKGFSCLWSSLQQKRDLRHAMAPNAPTFFQSVSH